MLLYKLTVNHIVGNYWQLPRFSNFPISSRLPSEDKVPVLHFFLARVNLKWTDEETMNQDTEEKLVTAALATRKLAYAPYSNFLVGAALLTETGEIFTGCNVENASYGLAICAERTAICKAVSESHRRIKAIVIAAVPLATPCGACRQFIVEFGKDIEVVCVDAENPKNRNRWTSADLIPDSFSF